MANIGTKIKKFGLEIYYFFTSRAFWSTFFKQIFIIVSLFVSIYFGVKWFTWHDKTLEVDSYINKNMSEVQLSAQDKGFNIVVTDSVYSPDMPENIVLEQTPAPFTRVKYGRNIYFKISKSKGSLVPIPDIAGTDNVDDYMQALIAAKIKVSKIETILNPKLADGTILQVLVGSEDVYKKLHEGIRVREGSSVQLVIAKHKIADNSLPPYVVEGEYLTFEKYAFILNAHQLFIKEIQRDPSVLNDKMAFVVKVDAPFEGEISKGDSIVVYLSAKNPTAAHADNFEEH